MDKSLIVMLGRRVVGGSASFKRVEAPAKTAAEDCHFQRSFHQHVDFSSNSMLMEKTVKVEVHYCMLLKITTS